MWCHLLPFPKIPGTKIQFSIWNNRNTHLSDQGLSYTFLQRTYELSRITEWFICQKVRNNPSLDQGLRYCSPSADDAFHHTLPCEPRTCLILKYLNKLPIYTALVLQSPWSAFTVNIKWTYNDAKKMLYCTTFKNMLNNLVTRFVDGWYCRKGLQRTTKA